MDMECLHMTSAFMTKSWLAGLPLAQPPGLAQLHTMAIRVTRLDSLRQSIAPARPKHYPRRDAVVDNIVGLFKIFSQKQNLLFGSKRSLEGEENQLNYNLIIS